jgi:hypothetical protein
MTLHFFQNLFGHLKAILHFFFFKTGLPLHLLVFLSKKFLQMGMLLQLHNQEDPEKLF